MEAVITLLPGDGIGPEVTTAARGVLEQVADRFGHRFDFARNTFCRIAIPIIIDITQTDIPYSLDCICP